MDFLATEYYTVIKGFQLCSFNRQTDVCVCVEVDVLGVKWVTS